MADANRTAIRIARETAPAVAGANPLFKTMRITSVSLSYTPDTTTSNELRSDRNVTDLILTGFTSGGDVPAEYSIGNTDVLTEGLMMNPWLRSPEVFNGQGWQYGPGSAAATRITAVSTTAITLAANSTLVGSQVSQANTAFVAGMLVYLSGFGIADQILAVTASSATSLTVAGATAVAAPPATARVKCIGFQATSGDVVATTTGGNALTSTTLNFTTLTLTVGQWIYLGTGAYGFSGFSGFARISAIAANRLSFDMVPANFAADAGTGKTIRGYFTDNIFNGVVENITYTVEEEWALAAGLRWMYHVGQEVNSRVITAAQKAIITDVYNFMGLNAQPIAAARLTGASTIAASQGTVLNSSTAIPLFYEGGSPVTTPNYCSNFTMTLANNKRDINAVGVLGAADIGSGRFMVTGTMTTYFGSEVLYNKLIGNTISSLTIAFNDSAKNLTELWDIPKLKYSGGVPDISGIDTDITLPLAFTGLVDVANNRSYTLMISRFEYYA